MKNILKAMEIESEYLEYRKKNEEPWHLIDKIVAVGYESLGEYFAEKREYLFSQWIPEIRYIDIDKVSDEAEKAIVNGDYCVIIPIINDLYAWHGNDLIDYELCKELGVQVIEMNYNGGTIVGSAKDFSIEIVMPLSFGMTKEIIIDKMLKIVSKYIDGVEVSGNDLLLNGYKVMGSMSRQVGNSFVWAAQISFGDYSDIIPKICNKSSVKKPSYIDSAFLTKETLENEVISWLQKR